VTNSECPAFPFSHRPGIAMVPAYLNPHCCRTPTNDFALKVMMRRPNRESPGSRCRRIGLVPSLRRDSASLVAITVMSGAEMSPATAVPVHPVCSQVSASR
jgi:hypothetical protein